MRPFFKILSSVGFVATFVIFGMVFYGTKSIPDSIHLVGNEKLIFSEIYSYEVEPDSYTVSVNSDNSASENPTDEEYTVDISVLKSIPVKSANVSVSERKYVIPSGDVFGIRLFTEGVIVVGTDDVYTETGVTNPAKTAGIETGDILLKINGTDVNSASEVEKMFQAIKGEKAKITLKRNKKTIDVELIPALSKNEKCYKAGVWVRDSMAGVGTVTYIDSTTGCFGGLGHAVCDVDTGVTMPLADGDAIKTEISGCYKGASGTTGELCGVFQDRNIGSLTLNCSCGIYGYLNDYDKSAEAVPVASKQEIKIGAAQIIATVDGDGSKYYNASIVKICNNDSESSKNMIIEITDENLISKTGGIVQGMSGSPIIQNGMLVGAITHVFVNNPLQGYAVYADNMIKISDNLSEKTTDKAS